MCTTTVLVLVSLEPCIPLDRERSTPKDVRLVLLFLAPCSLLIFFLPTEPVSNVCADVGASTCTGTGFYIATKVGFVSLLLLGIPLTPQLLYNSVE